MKPHPVSIDRRNLFSALATLVILFVPLLPVSTLAEAPSAVDALPSWNDGAAKQAIVNFVKATTDKSSPDFVPPEERIATFDQDGTLWASIRSTARRCTASIVFRPWSRPSRNWRMSSPSRRLCQAIAR
jgi:hypothetical protein